MHEQPPSCLGVDERLAPSPSGLKRSPYVLDPAQPSTSSFRLPNYLCRSAVYSLFTVRALARPPREWRSASPFTPRSPSWPLRARARGPEASSRRCRVPPRGGPFPRGQAPTPSRHRACAPHRARRNPRSHNWATCGDASPLHHSCFSEDPRLFTVRAFSKHRQGPLFKPLGRQPPQLHFRPRRLSRVA